MLNLSTNETGHGLADFDAEWVQVLSQYEEWLGDSHIAATAAKGYLERSKSKLLHELPGGSSKSVRRLAAGPGERARRTGTPILDWERSALSSDMGKRIGEHMPPGSFGRASLQMVLRNRALTLTCLFSAGMTVIRGVLRRPFKSLRAFRFGGVFARDAIYALLLHGFCGRLVRYFSPKLVVVYDHTSRFELALACETLKSGGKSACVQHGLIADSFGLERLPFVLFFAFGDSSAEVLRKRNPGMRIEPVGAILYDPLLNQNYRDECRAEGLQATGHWKGKSVLFISQPCLGGITLEAKRTVLEWLRQMAVTDPETRVIVRKHPREDDGAIESASEGMPGEKWITPPGNTPIHSLLCSADVTVTFHSSAGFEAILAGMPLIRVGYPYFMPLPFFPENLVPQVQSYEALYRTCYDLAQPQGLAEYLNKRAVILDHSVCLAGNSARRCGRILAQAAEVLPTGTGD